MEANVDTSRMQREIHAMPEDMMTALQRRDVIASYNARPAYQQNDSIGWIVRAKRPETRTKRLNQMLDELESGRCIYGRGCSAPRSARRTPPQPSVSFTGSGAPSRILVSMSLSRPQSRTSSLSVSNKTSAPTFLPARPPSTSEKRPARSLAGSGLSNTITAALSRKSRLSRGRTRSDRLAICGQSLNLLLFGTIKIVAFQQKAAVASSTALPVKIQPRVKYSQVNRTAKVVVWT